MPDPTTQDLITETRTKLDQLIAQVATLEAAITTQIPPALTSTLIDTRDKLQELITKLQADLDRLIEYQDAYVNPDSSTLQQWEDALELFEISLTVVSGGLGSDTGWDRDQERVRAAYKAVYRIIQKIAVGLYSGDIVRGVLQFIDTFGGTTLQLTLERTSGTTPYAETQNPGGNIIFLYTAPDTTWRLDDINRGYIVHTAENITHEFGHVLAFRNGSDNSAMYQEWNSIQIYISDFETTLGWSAENFQFLQNQSLLIDLPRNELEHERIANMFEALITGYDPDTGATDSRQLRAAWAMQTFMTANVPPSGVCIDSQQCSSIVGTGILNWVKFYGGN